MVDLHPKALEYLTNWPLFDNQLAQHGFAPDLRDYDVFVNAAASDRPGYGMYLEGRYRYRFTHCVAVAVDTRITDALWQDTWSDAVADSDGKQAPEPTSWVWQRQDCYPGATYVEHSPSAEAWTIRLGRAMHEVVIETDVQILRLTFHRLLVHRVAHSHPTDPNQMLECAPEELLGHRDY